MSVQTPHPTPDPGPPAASARIGSSETSVETSDDGEARRDDELAALQHLAQTLTAGEKVALLVGADAWSTTPIERVGLRSIRMSDGPVGVRGTAGHSQETSAMMPAPSALAATWDPALAARVGALFASEARRHAVDVVLAPQVNLQRTPVSGRHFECYSEDPHLTSEIAVPLVAAAQAEGIGMCVKHYVANDSETERTSYLSRVDQQTLREVYLAPFERLVADAGAWSVMGAYSGVDDGERAAPALEHRPLLTGVLKHEWGFDGAVVSDWVATKSVGPAVRGGLDLQMPGPDGVWGEGLADAVARGDVAESELDDKVVRLLRLAHRVGALDLPGVERAPSAPGTDLSPQEAAEVLREVTARSVVVLKDDAGLVPLDLVAAGVESIALLGPAARHPFIQGGGSSLIRPDHVTTPADELAAALGDGVTLSVHDGARSRLHPEPLDLHARVIDPATGGPGVHAELLGANGEILEAGHDVAWPGWLPEVRPDADAMRVTADVRLPEPGVHTLAFGTVGAHVARIDGAVISESGAIADENVVLTSEHAHPRLTTVEVAGPATIRLDARLQVVHAVGYGHFTVGTLRHRTPDPSPEESLADAVAAAARADVAVVVVGTTEEVESEGFDRADLRLPGNQDELVRRVVEANPRTVVVVNAGAPVLLPWLDAAPTVLWAWLGGQESGTSLTDVLLGKTEPSGRLPWTLPARAEDVPVPHAVPTGGVIDYDDGLDIGYRAWERLDRRPAAPFGHGLGWTTWEHEHAEIEAIDADGGLRVAVRVRNTGPRAGREVVQAYLEFSPDAGEEARRPTRWLAGFGSVDVEAGAGASCEVVIPRRLLECWDTGSRTWRTPAGRHTLRIGRSIRDLRLTVDVPTSAQ